MNNKRCYVEISLDNLKKNYLALREYLSSDQQIIPVVKDDFYGHGAVETSKCLEKLGVETFAVATIDEALELRNADIDKEIIILGHVDQDGWQIALEKNITLSIGSIEQFRELEAFVKEKKAKMHIEIQVDTGMHRNGLLAYDTSLDEIKEIYSNEYLKVTGTYSHLCTSDSFLEKDIKNTYKQKENFDLFLDKVRSLGLNTGKTHLSASAGVLNYPEIKYDAVRVGFMLLGFDVGEVKNKFERLPLLSWYSQVCGLRNLEKGDAISYGHTYTCDSKKVIATISVGYGDGYPRRLSNKGYVLIRGQKAKIVGRICMDQLMVDVTDIKDVSLNDKVTLIGKDGDSIITANEFANMADTIVDEIVCSINKRVQRYYLEELL